MAVKTYDEVMKDLRKEAIEVPDEIPPERGEFREALAPGSYRFRCPAALGFEPFEVAKRDAEGRPVDDKGNVVDDVKKAATLQYLNLVFDDAHPLTITQSPGSKTDGEAFYTRVSNLPRKRFVSKGVFVLVSDLTYLLRAKAPDARPKTNDEFAQVAAQVLANQEFGADAEWSGFCNKAQDAYFAFVNEATGETTYQPWFDEALGETENRKGCGERIFPNKWPKDPATGHLAERAKCTCGAMIRPFANLVRFKA